MGDTPLAGLRVVVTRPQRQAAALCDAFAAAGALVVRLPAFRVEQVTDGGLEAALGPDAVARHDTVVFTSTNAVEFFFDVAGRAGLHSLSDVEVAAVGPTTAGALADLGVPADVVADPHTAEGLVAALRAVHGETLSDRRVLYPKAREARDLLERELSRSGARVDAIILYQTVAETIGAEVLEELRTRSPDVITFASPSAARYLDETLDTHVIARIKSHSVAACIGPVTARAAGELGYRVDIVAVSSTAAGLVDAVIAHYHKES